MKSIINKIILSAAIGTAGLAFSGCTNLDETLYQDIASETHTMSESELEATIAPVYSSLRDVYWGWFGMSDIMDMSSDVWGVPNRIGIGWGDLYIPMHKHDFNSEMGFFEVNWNNNFAGVNACNKILANEAITSNKDIVAQVRAYRALYYYNLFDLFRNIPLDTTFVHESGWLPDQADPKTTFDWIESELKAVADECPSKVEMGKINKYAVHMLLAKLYLNHNAWFKDDNDKSWYGKCIDEINEVIKGPFSLASTYSANFMEDISSSPEIIFGIPFENKYAGGNYMANLWQHNAGRARWNFSGWATGGGAVFPQFLDTYEKGDTRYDVTWTAGQQYAMDGSAILVDGEPLVYTRELHSIDNPGCYPFESERLIKYEIKSGDFGTSYDDVPYFRLADAYYMKAECLLRLGGYKDETEDDAAKLVTAVRMRAFNNDATLATVTAEQLKGGSSYNYGHRENTAKQGEPDNWVITEEGGADIELGGLLDEYAKEFVCEGHRRDDLIRFNIKGTNMNVYCGKSWFCKDAETDRHCDIFPIPKKALDGNSKLKQNPGYGS
ncbi:MAG: RagB/SusD family nutrient uptake outer membrane protein [Prevotella sp.]|nr:RagB/SusD family nutrient uptake outer membrane protein [Prevotella sp.]